METSTKDIKRKPTSTRRENKITEDVKVVRRRIGGKVEVDEGGLGI